MKMAFRFVLFLIILTKISRILCSDEIATEEPTRILGGRVSRVGEAPFVVSLQLNIRNLGHFCGGSLVSSSHVLTAAHCFNGINTQAVHHLLDVVHDIDCTYKKGTDMRQVRKADRALIHHGYKGPGTSHDLALLLLQKPFKMDSQTTTAVLATITFPDKQNCLIYGWGAINNAADVVARQLKVVPVLIDIDLTCSYRDPESEICAGNVEGDNDACTGDSGGPLICEGLLTGLVSRGFKPCAEPLTGTIYTNLSYYKDWINKGMRTIKTLSAEIPQGKIISSIKDGVAVPNPNHFLALIFLTLIIAFF